MTPLEADLRLVRSATTRKTALWVLGRPAWARLNKRRYALIVRKNRGGLPADERAEYELLQAESRRLVFLAAPFTPPDELDARMKFYEDAHLPRVSQ